MSEFKLKRTTREWVLNRDFATDSDYSVSKLDVEGRFAVRGGPRFAESQADPMGSRGGIEFTNAQFEALVRLWERELRAPQPVSEGDPPLDLCLAGGLAEHFPDISSLCQKKHVCTNFNTHPNELHKCPCGFEWE